MINDPIDGKIELIRQLMQRADDALHLQLLEAEWRYWSVESEFLAGRITFAEWQEKQGLA